MSLLKIIPKVIYDDISIGMQFFKALGFESKYEEEGFAILGRDGITIQIVASEEGFAIDDRPEFRIDTDDIEAIYNEIKANHPEVLHPNLKVIKQQPWGLKEFAVRDATSVCIVFQQAY
ncbi:MAG: hypothetical protein AAGC65_13695 [Mucilaginibacter sp.]|uniref:hypothetical protein n=1 Tax=Mucilaginibacter sp. TaxID=1882438 RepID=UPI0031A821C5